MDQCRNCERREVRPFVGNWEAQFCSYRCQIQYFRVYLIGIFIILFFLIFVLRNLIIFLFFVFFIFVIYWAYSKDPTETTNTRIFSSQRMSRWRGQEEQAETSSKNLKFTPEERIFVEELDQQFKLCCYQSARLGDTYCLCGRAVDQELIDLLNDYE